MKFWIERVSCSTKSPSKNAHFEGFVGKSTKTYTIECNTIDELIGLSKENKNCDIRISRPYKKGDLWHIELEDVDYEE